MQDRPKVGSVHKSGLNYETVAVQPNSGLVNVFPSRSVNHIPDSTIIVRSDFCSGNLSKACRGAQKNQIDLWIASDCDPYYQGENYYKTWFYFSVTGVPQGEQITFTFRNLHN